MSFKDGMQLLKAATNVLRTRIDLLPHRAIRECGQVMALGAEKHPYESWKSLPWRVHAEKAHRHLNAHMCGDFIDPDSQLPHLANAAVRLLMLLEVYQEQTADDGNEANDFVARNPQRPIEQTRDADGGYLGLRSRAPEAVSGDCRHANVVVTIESHKVLTERQRQHLRGVLQKELDGMQSKDSRYPLEGHD